MPSYAYDTLTDAVAAIERIEWSGVFRFDPHGGVVAVDVVHPYGDIPHAPEQVEADDEDDVLIDGGMSEWSAMIGLTGQHGYRGAVMHCSETLSPGIVAAMRDVADGQVFCLVPVEAKVHGPDEHNPGCDVPFGACDVDGDEPAGWAILLTDDPTRRMYYHQAEDAYEEWIDQTHDTVTLCGSDYDAGRLLRLADPIAFRCGVADWADSEGIEII